MDGTKIHRADGADGGEIQLEQCPHTQEPHQCFPQRPFVNTHAGIRILLFQHLLRLPVQLRLARFYIFQADIFFLTHNFLPFFYLRFS